MKSKHRRALAITALTLLPIIAFQNCAQNGPLGGGQAMKFTSAEVEAEPAVAEPVVEEVPVEMPAEIKYKNYSKVISAAETSNKVDVLVVIDNSKSMVFEQTNMAQRFGSFLTQLQNVDWQVGIITTDVSLGDSATADGRLLKYNSAGKRLISSKDGIESAKSLFSSTIQRTEIGNAYEQGIKASYRALERAAVASDANAALIRQNSALSIIVVTDADETGSTTQNNPDNLHKYITTKYPGKSFKFHSIIVRKGDVNCANDKSKVVKAGVTHENINEGYGVIYSKLSEKTSGIIGSVCQADYGNQLSMIGQSTSQQVKQATLDCAPADRDNNGYADIEIRNAQTNSLISNYVVNGVQISFDQPLAAGSYNISYTCIAN